jgi:hypothetical protein
MMIATQDKRRGELDHWLGILGSVVVCPDCQRRFALAVPDDADEWHHGHDCEVADTVEV